MSHSYVKIWIHAIWATKNRAALISSNVERDVHQHIVKQLQAQKCFVKIVNGMPDHVHCLFMINKQHSISEIIKQVKGSTSHYINQNNLIPEKFAWQTGYAAFSVSESAIDKVYRYIKNQKEHHRRKLFQEEYNEFLKLYGFGDEK
jgi:REP element-mobilizing transposase RayT